MVGTTVTNPEGEPQGKDRKRIELFHSIETDLGADGF